jgi:gas vesicle protein
MSENVSMNYGARLVGGLVVGTLAGAGIALLLAPRSGAETRQQLGITGTELRRRGQGFTGLVKERAVVVQARAKEMLGKQRGKLQVALGEGQAAAAKTREELEARLATARGELAPAMPF